MNTLILSEEVLHENGAYVRVRRYLAGQYPALGILHQGWTGWETIVEMDILRPSHTFNVVAKQLRKAA